MTITFDSDVRFWSIIYWYDWNWTWELLTNSNSHNFWLGCPIQTHIISRLLKINNGSSREIQMVISFLLDVRFRLILYRDARNKTWKHKANSNDHNFSLGCLIQAHNISRRSKLKNGSSREIQMVITFHSEVRFRLIIYEDAQNWTTEALEKFKLS